MPGKHSVAQTSVVWLGMFGIVSTIGSAMETGSLRAPTPTPDLVIVGVLSVVAAIFRRRRRRRWQETPLMFDDELPSDIQPLGLSEG